MSTQKFSIGKPLLTQFNSVDGYGRLNRNEQGVATWFIIPYKTAAEKENTLYAISGTLIYKVDGSEVVVPLLPDIITVQPDPQLNLIYFLEKYVRSDNPLTPEIEPTIPFTLGLLLTNNGYGTATDVKITSSQPKIVENEKGLLIDFKIVKCILDNQVLTSSLTVQFGDLKPNETKQVLWSLTSTLKGEFINISSTFQNKNPNGDPKLSIIYSIEYTICK